jgi:hypothetical protein
VQNEALRRSSLMDVGAEVVLMTEVTGIRSDHADLRVRETREHQVGEVLRTSEMVIFNRIVCDLIPSQDS